MTSIRFAGELPLWVGLMLAFIVAVLSWRYYRRESFDLPRKLRWVLPLLRATAFFIGLMILTGPVLHHRKVIGELGKIRIYVDGSRSMSMRDQHMSTGRKLLIAEQLGWLAAGKLDGSLMNTAQALATARRQLVDRLTAVDLATESSPDPSNSTAAVVEPSNSTRPTIRPAAIRAARDELLEQLQRLAPELERIPVTTQPAAAQEASTSTAGTDKNPPATPDNSLASRLRLHVIQPLQSLSLADDDPSPADQVAELLSLADRCLEIEQQVRAEFERVVQALVEADDEAVLAALVQFDQTARWRRAEAALVDSSADVLSRLQERHDLNLFLLAGDEARSLEPARMALDATSDDDGGRLLSDDDLIDATNLSSGITATQQGSAWSETTTSTVSDNGPRAAIVLITDGQHNSGPSPLQLARVLGSQGIPFYCVALGATQPAPDLAVVGLEYPEMVFQKDLVRGVMIVRDGVAAGTPFVAQIQHEDEVLWQQQLVTEDSTERRIEFEFPIDELVGRLGSRLDARTTQHSIAMALQASIAPLPQESETANNQKTMRLAAITQRYQVLILDGRSRWETRYLRNAFERDDQWDVDTVIAGPGTDEPELPRGDQQDQFPTDRSSLLEYDLIVLGEVSPDLFRDHELQWLREFVELRGGGLICIDGQRQRLQQFTQSTLAPLLPIEWMAEPFDKQATSLVLTDQGASVSSLNLATDQQQNRRFWTELPAPHTMSHVTALPAGEVLVEFDVAGQRHPAIVTQLYGAGRVLYLAFDETWRWRYKVADTWHQRFWNQVANYVMPRPFAVSGEYLAIDTGPVSYDFGDTVDVRIKLTGLDGRPAENVLADALVWKDGRIVSTITLEENPQLPGTYRGKSAPLTEGDYEVSVQAAGYSDAALQVRSRFTVLPPESGEMVQTAANESLLNQMAAASGGMYLREEAIGQLPELLSPLSRGQVVESETLLWQSYWWFTAIILLLTAEWILRKRAGLL